MKLVITTMKITILRFFIFLPISILCSCSEDSAMTTSSIHYTNQNFSKSFKNELKMANIPYKIKTDKEGKEYIHWDSKFDKHIKKIKNKVIGIRPPEGRSLRLGIDTNIIQEMEDSKIPYTKIKYHTLEYIVWTEEYAEKVEQIFVNRRKEADKKKNGLNNWLRITLKYLNGLRNQRWLCLYR